MTTSLFDLTGRIALITGGSRGLGLEIARAYARHGADVIIASRKLENCVRAADEIVAMGRRAMPYQLHAGRWDEMNAMVEHVYREWGRIDILVNNAGMSPHALPEDIDERLFDSVLNLNFKGPFRLSVAVGERMYRGDGGAIINVSSSGGLIPIPHASAYGAAKAALNSMTKTLAFHYAPKVRANVLSAGPFLTDVSKAWAPEKRETSNNALGRPGQPGEIVAAALFLAGPGASYTTGAMLQVDGGIH